jgi:hypothetical protein
MSENGEHRAAVRISLDMVGARHPGVSLHVRFRISCRSAAAATIFLRRLAPSEPHELALLDLAGTR